MFQCLGLDLVEEGWQPLSATFGGADTQRKDIRRALGSSDSDGCNVLQHSWLTPTIRPYERGELQHAWY